MSPDPGATQRALAPADRVRPAPARLRATLRRTAGRLLAGRDGVAAIEFALFAPFLILLYVGCVEISNFTSNVRKVGILTRAIGELTSQGETIDATMMRDIFRSSDLILPPFDGAAAMVKLSAVGTSTKTGGGQSLVCSVGATGNAQARNVGEDVSHLFPEEEVGNRFLYIEVEMPYRFLFATAVLGAHARPADGFLIKKAVKWPVRKGVRKKSHYPEILLPTGKACET